MNCKEKLYSSSKGTGYGLMLLEEFLSSSVVHIHSSGAASGFLLMFTRSRSSFLS